MKIRSKIKTILVTNLNMADVKTIYEILDSRRVTTRCGSERNEAKVGVLCHHVAHNLVIGIFACSFMRFVFWGKSVNTKT